MAAVGVVILLFLVSVFGLGFHGFPLGNEPGVTFDDVSPAWTSELL